LTSYFVTVRSLVMGIED